MRRAMVAISSRAAPSSSSDIFASLRSRLRRRSTARPSRKLSAAMMVPTAVSRKTGATASWITEAISGRWVSTATAQLLRGRCGLAFDHALDDAARPQRTGVDIEIAQRSLLQRADRVLLRLDHRPVLLEYPRIRLAQLRRQRLVSKAVVAHQRPEVHAGGIGLGRDGVEHAPGDALAAVALRRPRARQPHADVEHDSAGRLEADDLPAI